MIAQYGAQLSAVLAIMSGMLVTPLLFIALDYWAGTRKAVQRGEKIRSDKMKRTIYKISKYYNACLAMLVIDVMQMAAFIFMSMFYGWTAYTVPVFTFGAVMFTAFVEIRSILEPATVKETRDLEDVAALAKDIVASRNDPKKIAQAVADFIVAQTKE